MSGQPDGPEAIDPRYAIHIAVLVGDGSTIKDNGAFHEAILLAFAAQGINPDLTEAWIERNLPAALTVHGHELGGKARLDEQCITLWQTRRTGLPALMDAMPGGDPHG